ncbi:thiol-disulfide isomerase/thioredoxin [Bosea sp. BE271]|uniref:TlpA family protein disulfide reductase n=2 Tax=Boseaceae TaxID=2831100 RepID=UPI00285503D3|nr:MULTISPECIES: TlpA family protein disulfide reductase [Bosea]MDR6828112.1 thiol-disulfide isomerase/thioredoxin [Bosea robiniae]MDR6894738.1 thiol-disulfide isomerase/thioredoxin [Bosea sp. BE109]MDR7138218.1 thiol-disulfide isomerase/thioredoxin [Bosea sp. BE168]MDR7174917.1 thiol-disulfide isomerase/thioredoxin [Bosea sp. BE271]
MMSGDQAVLAPELAVSEWFNTSAPLTLAGLRGRPVFLHTFQLLCPGCIAQAIPQVQRIERVFAGSELQIIGVHTVFEHHAAMSPVTLRAFLHEYRLRSPVGVDLAEEGSDIPVTMRRFGLRGTPSSVLIGRDGAILHHAFGVEEDLALGARIAMALSAPATELRSGSTEAEAEGCDAGRCEAPAMTGAV